MMHEDVKKFCDLLREAEEVLEETELRPRQLLCLVGLLYRLLYDLEFWLKSGKSYDKRLYIQQCSALNNDMQAARDLLTKIKGRHPTFFKRIEDL